MERVSIESTTSLLTQPQSQPKRPYRSPYLQDYGTVQGLTASGFGGSKNEAAHPGFTNYVNSI